MKNRKKLLLLLPLFLLASCKNDVVDKNQYDNMYDHICSMWERTLSEHDYNIAFYGDSRVAGGKFEEQFSQYNVVNLGIGGDRVSNCIRRFNLIEAAKPETVFLSIGGNDAISSEFNKDIFISEFNQLLNKFKTAGINVIIHTSPGLAYVDGLSQKDVEKINAKIATINVEFKRFANEFNYKLLDLEPLLDNSDGSLKVEYTTEGVHFNEAAYSVWFGEVQKIINTLNL